MKRALIFTTLIIFLQAPSLYSRHAKSHKQVDVIPAEEKQSVETSQSTKNQGLSRTKKIIITITGLTTVLLGSYGSYLLYISAVNQLTSHPPRGPILFPNRHSVPSTQVGPSTADTQSN